MWVSITNWIQFVLKLTQPVFDSYSRTGGSDELMHTEHSWCHLCHLSSASDGPGLFLLGLSENRSLATTPVPLAPITHKGYINLFWMSPPSSLHLLSSVLTLYERQLRWRRWNCSFLFFHFSYMVKPICVSQVRVELYAPRKQWTTVLGFNKNMLVNWPIDEMII